MFDDPRWGDHLRDRDDERVDVHRDRAGRDSSVLDRGDDWKQPESSRDRDDDSRTLGPEFGRI